MSRGLSDVIRRGGVIDGVCAQKGVALFHAEVWHIDLCGGVRGQKAQGGAGGRLIQRLAQAQDGQGAEQVSGVDFGHGACDRGAAGAGPRECDQIAP